MAVFKTLKSISYVTLLGLSIVTTTDILAITHETAQPAPSENAEVKKDWMESTAEGTENFLHKAREMTIKAFDAIKNKWNETFGDQKAKEPNEKPKSKEKSNEEALNL
ncbi:MAG TPA: hypothetical protein VJ205_01740 [Gammaproteobacteria bacterium]|nr:hypothetical protein [Gammaproteobacteria bacterium]